MTLVVEDGSLSTGKLKYSFSKSLYGMAMCFLCLEVAFIAIVTSFSSLLVDLFRELCMAITR